MKNTLRLLIATLALAFTGCTSFNTASLQGLNVASFQWKETYPAVGFSIAAFGVKTDSLSGVTSVDSMTVSGYNPFGGGGGTITGLVLDPKKPAQVLTVSGPSSATVGK